MKVTFKNFEILSDVELPIEGITVLVGASHNGKSSVKRGIENIFDNTAGDGFITYGAGQSVCTLTVPQAGCNHNLTKSRDGRGTTYFVDGEKYEKVGQGRHLELLAPFGIRELKTSTRTVMPNIVGQFDQQFLTAYTPSEAFSFLSFLLDESRLQACLKSIGAGIRVQNEELGQVQAVIDVNKAELLGLEGTEKRVDKLLDSVGLQVQMAMEALGHIEERAAIMAPIPALCAEITLQQGIVASGLSDMCRTTVEAGAYWLNNETPHLQAAEVDLSAHTRAAQEASLADDAVSVLMCMVALGGTEYAASVVPNITQADNLLSELAAYIHEYCRAKEDADRWEGRNADVPDSIAKSVGVIANSVGELDQYRTAQMEHALAVSVLSSIVIPVGVETVASVLPNLTAKESELQNWEYLSNTAGVQARHLGTCLQDQSVVSDELISLEGSIEVCPMCSSRLGVVEKETLLTNLKKPLHS